MAVVFDNGQPSIRVQETLASCSSVLEDVRRDALLDESDENEKRFHKCDVCSKSFKVKDNLCVHKLITHGGGNGPCPLCGKIFNRAASFKAHAVCHQVEETINCSDCGLEMTDYNQLTKHSREHRKRTKDQRWNCKYCPRVFTENKYYKEHITAHRKLATALSHRRYTIDVDRSHFRFKCDVCSKSFEKPSQLARHNLIHTGEKPYICGDCGKAFNQKGSLQTHQKHHSGQKQHVCQFCSASFTQRGNLRSHVERVHTVSTEDVRDIFYCHLCSCVFRKVGSLNTHLSKNHSVFNYAKVSKSLLENGEKSKDCAKVISDSSISIEGVKWYECYNCSKKFKKPSDLIKHIRTHTNEKPFHCLQCNRSFAVKSTLTAHIRTHSSLKQFNCQICCKDFARRSTLNTHMKKHK